NSLIQAEARRHPGVIYADSWGLFSNGQGRYSAFLPGPSGAQAEVRTGDGVHLTAAGDDRLAGLVLDVMAPPFRPAGPPAPATVLDVVPPLAPLVAPGDPLFVGGPVQPQGAVLLAEFESPDEADVLVFGSIGFLVGAVAPEQAEGVRRARVFAGYAGWGP